MIIYKQKKGSPFHYEMTCSDGTSVCIAEGEGTCETADFEHYTGQTVGETCVVCGDTPLCGNINI